MYPSKNLSLITVIFQALYLKMLISSNVNLICLSEMQISDTNLEKSEFAYAELDDASIKNVIAKDVKMNKSGGEITIDGSNFSESNLQVADLSEASITNSEFDEIEFAYGDLSDAQIDAVSMNDCERNNAVFKGGSINSVDFQESNFFKWQIFLNLNSGHKF